MFSVACYEQNCFMCMYILSFISMSIAYHYIFNRIVIIIQLLLSSHIFIIRIRIKAPLGNVILLLLLTSSSIISFLFCIGMHFTCSPHGAHWWSRAHRKPGLTRLHVARLGNHVFIIYAFTNSAIRAL